nr:hypothetical protein [uncultured Parabacteroides sp.]
MSFANAVFMLLAAFSLYFEMNFPEFISVTIPSFAIAFINLVATPG